MSLAEHRPDIERLLEQSGWARRLALRLVSDAGLADDLVQDAFVAALERPPRGSGGREWLGVVVRNLSLRRRRREAARSGVERRAARREAVDGGGEEALQRLELQRLLADLLLAIDEPYRTAVVLRHVEGRSAREIARLQRCSEEAARQRVARGLARLRKELDARSGGDRSAWCGTVVALCGAREANLLPVALTGAGATLIGGTLVGIKTIVAAVAAGLTLGGAAWWMRDGASAIEPARPLAAEATEPALEISPGVTREIAAADGRSVATVATAAPAAALPSASARWEGRTLGSNGAPLAGVEVHLLDRQDDEPLASATSDAAGAFRFDRPAGGGVPDGRAWRLRAEHDGCVPLDVNLSGPPFGDLVLLERPRITGVVLLPDGTPAAPPGQVELEVRLPSGEREGCRVEIDGRGRFTATELVPGQLDLSKVRVRGYGPDEHRHDLLLEPGARYELTLTVPLGATVRGVVIDADTEQPLPFAEVWSDSWTYDAESVEPSTVADAEGRFVLRGVEARPLKSDSDTAALAWVQASARAEGYRGRPFEPWVVHVGEDGAYEGLVLRITRSSGSIRGRLTWPGGSPATGLQVYVIDDAHNLRYETTDSDGHFACDGLSPGPARVCARTDPDHEALPQGRVDASVELAAGAQETLELVLGLATGSIGGRVVDGVGRPLEGVSLEAGEHVVGGGLTVGVGHRRTTTDANGRYVFAGLVPGRYQVELSGNELGEHAARPSHVTVDLEHDRPREDVDFELVPGAEFSGWIDVGEDDPRSYRVERRRLVDDERLDRVEPDAEGRFRFGACWPEACALLLERDGERLARVEVGAGGAEGIVLARAR